MLRVPLYKLKEEMPYDEFVGWHQYFNKRPPGWKEDHRTALLMKTFGFSKNPEDIFPSLKVINQAHDDESKLVSSLKRSAFFSKMLGSVGGERLDEVFK